MYQSPTHLITNADDLEWPERYYFCGGYSFPPLQKEKIEIWPRETIIIVLRVNLGRTTCEDLAKALTTNMLTMITLINL